MMIDYGGSLYIFEMIVGRNDVRQIGRYFHIIKWLASDLKKTYIKSEINYLWCPHLYLSPELYMFFEWSASNLIIVNYIKMFKIRAMFTWKCGNYLITFLHMCAQDASRARSGFGFDFIAYTRVHIYRDSGIFCRKFYQNFQKWFLPDIIYS